MSASVQRATMTLEIKFPEEQRPVLQRPGWSDLVVTGLLVTWERGQAVDSALSWHWFPLQASALSEDRDRSGIGWRYGALGRDGSAPQWVRDAVAAHRPEDEGELALRLKMALDHAAHIGPEAARSTVDHIRAQTLDRPK